MPDAIKGDRVRFSAARNGIRQDPVKWRATQRKAAENQIAKRRARVAVRLEGNRTTVRRTPLKRVSAARVRENKQRRRNVEAAFGADPLCTFPLGCCRFADDAHEVLSRARGGSITDPTNIRPLCREHHDLITREPLLAARLGLSRSAFGDSA